MQFVHKHVFDENYCYYNSTMVLLVTKVVLSERICFLRLKQIPNIKVVTFQSISIMPSRNSEDILETPSHTPDPYPRPSTVSAFDGHSCNCRSKSTWIEFTLAELLLSLCSLYYQIKCQGSQKFY